MSVKGTCDSSLKLYSTSSHGQWLLHPYAKSLCPYWKQKYHSPYTLWWCNTRSHQPQMLHNHDCSHMIPPSTWQLSPAVKSQLKMTIILPLHKNSSAACLFDNKCTHVNKIHLADRFKTWLSCTKYNKHISDLTSTYVNLMNAPPAAYCNLHLPVQLTPQSVLQSVMTKTTNSSGWKSLPQCWKRWRSIYPLTSY